MVRIETQQVLGGAPGRIGSDGKRRVSSRWIALRGVGIAVLALLALACGAPGPERAPSQHLILVSVDTLRADRLGAYGNPLELTPHLDALAKESILFRRAFAPAPFTLASLSALLTGHYPDAIGVQTNRAVVPASVDTLAERLRATGFRTGAVVGNFIARRQSGLDQGFERYDDRMGQRETRRLMPERRAASTTADALAMLDELREGDGRIFLWVHYQDPHGPYTAPSEYRAPPGPAPAGVRDRRLPVFPRDHIGLNGLPDYQQIGAERHSAFYRGAYHGEIRYLDAQVGALFEGIRARGLWEETTIAVTADHGEGLGEEGHWFAHGELVAPAETAVPLLLRVPGRSPAVRDDLASLLDLLPTLLAVVGAPPVDRASPQAPGRDLLASGAEERESALFLSNLAEGMALRRAILREGHQYAVIRARKGGGEQGRFRRLDGSQAEDTELLSRLRKELRELEAELAKGPPEVRQDLDELDRARLEALGYIVDEEP